MSNFLRKFFGGASPSKIVSEFDREISSTQEGRCKYCGKPIIWKNLKTGQRWPLDVEKKHCVDDEGNVFLAYVPHFETCPLWRKNEPEQK